MDDPFAAAPEAVAPASGVVVNRRIVVFDEGGNPVATTVPLITKPQIQDLLAAAAAGMFPATKDPFDPEFGLYDGMTCIEVAVRKQMILAARTGQVEVVLDRLLGKPKQSTESVRVNVNYEDWLKETAQKVAAKSRSIPGELA